MNRRSRKRAAQHEVSLLPWWKREWFFCLVLAVVTLLAYQPAWQGSPLWDDDFNITNPHLRSWDGLRRIWLEPGTTQQYYPLLHTSFWVQQKIWGDSSTGYHLVNFLLHIGCTVLVLKILRLLRIPGAELATIIFALHPVNVETVAWITERKNTLSGIFCLAATLSYLKFDEDRSEPRYLLALGLFLLGLMSKTAIVTLPLALLVIFWWKRGTLSLKKDLVPLIPFFLLSAASGLITFEVERGLIGPDENVLTFSPVERCLIAGRALLFQLGKVLWPTNLMFVYPRWEINAAVWWQYLFPLAVLGLLGVLWSMRGWSRAPLAGVLVYLCLLLPTLGLLNQYFFVFSFVSDHWQYLACLGIITPCASGLVLLARRWKLQQVRIEIGMMVALAGVLAILCWRQSRMYTDSETLYRTSMANNPNCWMAYNNLGLVLDHAGRLSEAIEQYEQALQIKPDYAYARNNLGFALARTGEMTEAVKQLETALRLKPDYPEAHNNLGNTLLHMGQTSEAMEQFDQALKSNPNYAEADYNLGNALYQTGRMEEAMEQYEQALRLKPDMAEAHNNLGLILVQMGRFSEAREHYEQALRINPDYTNAQNNLTQLESLQQN